VGEAATAAAFISANSPDALTASPQSIHKTTHRYDDNAFLIQESDMSTEDSGQFVDWDGYDTIPSRSLAVNNTEEALESLSTRSEMASLDSHDTDAAGTQFMDLVPLVEMMDLSKSLYEASEKEHDTDDDYQTLEDSETVDGSGPRTQSSRKRRRGHNPEESNPDKRGRKGSNNSNNETMSITSCMRDLQQSGGRGQQLIAGGLYTKQCSK
jgi:hypothetical protein